MPLNQFMIPINQFELKLAKNWVYEIVGFVSLFFVQYDLNGIT